MKTIQRLLSLLAALTGLTVLAPAPARAGETISIDAPKVVPRDTALGGYSPLVKVSYKGLVKAEYTLKVWLLEADTGEFQLGSTQAPWEFTLQGEAELSGAFLNVSSLDVHDYKSFRWVARLYKGTNEVAVATQDATSVKAGPPVLKPIRSGKARVGEKLQIALHAHGVDADRKLRFSAESLPPGSTLDPDAGRFEWVPLSKGVFSTVFIVTTPDGLTSADRGVFTVE